MREILFRGKRVDDGEWMFGNLTLWGDGGASIDQEPTEGSPLYAVDTETVGQFTGLTDKNGKRIFENDIVNIEYPKTTVKNCVIEYMGASFFGSTPTDSWELDGYYDIEVIGNIHDNPEILERSNEKCRMN